MDEQLLPQDSFSKKNFFDFFATSRKSILSFFLGAGIIFVLIIVSARPPSDFPSQSVVTISQGESLQQITTELQNAHVIRFADVFRSVVIILGGERRVVAGDYLLRNPQSVLTIAWRLIRGETYLDLVKITIPEGWTTKQMNGYLAAHLSNFDSAKFQKISSSSEGYLFPDTYFVSPLITPELLVDKMKNNFDQKISSVPDITSFGKPTSDVIIMASMLEDEARTTESRQIVAGILWKRLTMGIPLQVDSTISYVTGKALPDLTASDLKINSPYNTYIHTGLPPGPIGNPGLDALTSAVTPTTTPYLYYLSDKSGVMHYATTFAEHEKNIAKYLK